MDSFQLYATYYHSMGMNIAPIYGKVDDPSSFKRPGIDISKWHNERQSIEDVLSFEWANATGIGLITGFHGFRAIDIDGVKDDFLTDIFKYRFIGQILEQLGLPSNYEWLVLSGSGNGCHIIFQSDDISGMEIGNYSFLPGSFDDGYISYGYSAFERMEISWSFFLVLPPSYSLSEPSNQSYGFWNWDVLPFNKPILVSNEKIANMLFKWCGNDQELNYRFNGNDCRLFCRECILGYDRYQSYSISYNDCKGLLMSCDEGKNFFALVHKPSIDINLLRTLKCNNAIINTASLMAVGFIESSYTKVHKLLKELYDNKIINSYGYDDLTNLALLNCKQPNRLMFFDTETNGLSPRYCFDITDYPRIVQLSWIVADEDGIIEKKCGYLIKPIDFEILDEAVNVHGITKEKALREGVHIKEVIPLFLADLNNCNALVGHNVSFDIKVLIGELVRLKVANAINEMFNKSN